VKLAWIVVALVLASAPRVARADDPAAVALLPLDAEPRLELYGQPVASEVARALVAGGIDVVVVGPKMAVPERARLIVDGKLTSGKGDVVTIALRIRDRDTGSVLDQLSSNAPQLTSIDQAASDVSARVLPAVRMRLAALAPKAKPAPIDKPIAHRPSAPPAAPPALTVAITGDEPLRSALAAATDRWVRARHREPHPVTAQPALAIEIVDYTVEPGAVPLARARVHVQLGGAFDRVITTDTVVGDRDQPPAKLAERVATEVLAILSPNAARAMPELAP
jgi:hypothetical protein